MTRAIEVRLGVLVRSAAYRWGRSDSLPCLPRRYAGDRAMGVGWLHLAYEDP